MYSIGSHQYLWNRRKNPYLSIGNKLCWVDFVVKRYLIQSTHRQNCSHSLASFVQLIRQQQIKSTHMVLPVLESASGLLEMTTERTQLDGWISQSLSLFMLTKYKQKYLLKFAKHLAI